MQRTTRLLSCALTCMLALASQPALGTAAEPTSEAAADPRLEALQAEAQRYPQDYGAAARLAERVLDLTKHQAAAAAMVRVGPGSTAAGTCWLHRRPSKFP